MTLMAAEKGAFPDLWTMASRLWTRRRLLVLITGAACIASIVISLLLPKWYMAESRLLLPTRSGSGILASSILGGIPAAASSLLGGVSGDYVRYLSILDSRTVKENVVREFDLTTVYDVEDSAAPTYYAIMVLDDNIEFIVDEEYNHLVVRTYDQDPERAAAMTNYMVAELNRINSDLASQNAGRFRSYVEARYTEAEAELDSVAAALEALQERSGILDPTTQAQAFAEGVIAWRLNVWQAEIQHESLLELYGPGHSMVRSARRALDVANQDYQSMLAGQERLMPIAQDSIPAVAREFMDLEVEATILGSLLAATRPVLEEAKLEEQRHIEAVQVVDHAIPPPEKARPQRSVIVVASTFSAFLLAMFYVLLAGWWASNYRWVASRLAGSAS